jgi:hypothetical protein
MELKDTPSLEKISEPAPSREDLFKITTDLKELCARLQSTVESSKLDRQAVIEQMKESFLLSDQIGEAANKHFSDRVVFANNVVKQAKLAFANFTPSILNPEVRNNITFIKPGEDPKLAQVRVFRENMEALSESRPKAGMKLLLSESDIVSLGLDPRIREPQVLEPQAVDKVIDKIRFNEVHFQFDPLVYCMAAIEAEETIKEITNPNTGSPTEPSPPSGNSEANPSPANDADQFIKDKIGLQMQYTTPPEAKVLFGITPRATQEDLQKATDSFELRGGPADVTSYHDFYDLQIAFHHVWTELFDRELAELGQKLYGELVKLKSTFNEEIDKDVITSVEELQQLKDDLIQTRLTIAENDGRLDKVRKMLPEVTLENWARLDEPTKQNLFDSATKYETLMSGFFGFGVDELRKEEAQKIQVAARLNYLSQVSLLDLGAPAKKKSRVEHFLEDLEEHLKEKFAFHVFAPNSINFGILVTYRQEWKPLKYQVGELVSTIPLAPKEIRKYSTRKIVKKTRAEKEIEESLRIRKEESSYTSRDQAEIILKAENKTNFKQNAEGAVNFKVWNAKAGHEIEIDSFKQSSQVKKEFRESVLKAAQEYKNEHRLELDTSIAEETEFTSSGEITNPNDELPVTFLFYELERCYDISEKIHKLTPVIMVANDMPYPHEIDEDWLLRQDWILRRVILDDSYKKALDYLSEGFTGDEISIEVLRNSWKMQLDVVEKTARNVSAHQAALDAAQNVMEQAIEKYSANLIKESEGFIEKVGQFFVGGEEDDPTEMLRVRMDAAKEGFQRAERSILELRSQLAREVTTLQEATDKYTKALQERFNRRTEIIRLRAHVKDNILYYMQCIWDQEPPDQRFFRLYEQITVPVFDSKDFQYKVYPGSYIFPTGKVPVCFQIIAPRNINITYKKLVEVADLDNPLGYKGNYIIFPLKKSNAITMFMMQDYIEMREVARLRDPDELGEYTVENLRELLKCLMKLNPALVNDDLINKVKAAVIRRLSDPYPEKEMVIVPTTSLFIEALPGKHPILEDFKLVHRAVDVKKAQSEVRHAELENVRLSARTLKGDYEDPDIDKKLVISKDGVDVDIHVEP